MHARAGAHAQMKQAHTVCVHRRGTGGAGVLGGTHPLATANDGHMPDGGGGVARPAHRAGESRRRGTHTRRGERVRPSVHTRVPLAPRHASGRERGRGGRTLAACAPASSGNHCAPRPTAVRAQGCSSFTGRDAGLWRGSPCVRNAPGGPAGRVTELTSIHASRSQTISHPPAWHESSTSP